MRVAVRYSEYKSAGRLPFKENFDCSKCEGKPAQIKRNCRGLYGTKYRYQIGTMVFDVCPISIYVDDPEVIQVIDLILTSMESGIPIAGRCLLDQTKKFFDWRRIIRDEQGQCNEELNKVRQKEAEQERKRHSASSRQGRPRPFVMA